MPVHSKCQMWTYHQHKLLWYLSELYKGKIQSQVQLTSHAKCSVSSLIYQGWVWITVLDYTDCFPHWWEFKYAENRKCPHRGKQEVLIWVANTSFLWGRKDYAIYWKFSILHFKIYVPEIKGIQVRIGLEDQIIGIK